MSAALPAGISPTDALSTPSYQDGPAESIGDIHLNHRFFVCETPRGLVVGKNFNVLFTIDRPAQDVWPQLKDFNLWQNAYGHFYSGVIGDLEGRTFSIGSRPGEPDRPGPYQYRVVRIIPEHLIVARSADEESWPQPGFHVLMLSEFGGKTVVSVLMMHQTHNTSAEAGLQHHRQAAAESHRKWRDIFIPHLKKVVYDAADKRGA